MELSIKNLLVLKKSKSIAPPSLENQMVVALLMTQSDLDKPDTISYTVYNCPNTEKYRVNKIHIGRGS